MMSSATSTTSTKPVHALQATEGFRPSQAVEPTTKIPIVRQPSKVGNEPMTTPHKTTVLRAACDSCHRMKRKCDGKHPCTRCERRRRDCFYSCKQKSGPPKGSKRKLVEAEDDLPENRSTNFINPTWPGGNKMTEVGERSTAFVPMESTSSCLEMGPSPEARAAAAAAVAASHMSGISSSVNPALAAVGLRSPYLLAPPPGLPGLTSANVPVTAPLVTPSQYGALYQHQYPPEVYAVYLAELRQRSCSVNHLSNGSSITPAPFAGPVGLDRQSPAEATQAAADALAADVAAARNFSPSLSSSIDVTSNGARELLSDAINLINQVSSGTDISDSGSVTAPATAEGGQISDTTAGPNNIALVKMSNTPTQVLAPSPSEDAKEAAASAAASAALAAAVAAAIAENSPSKGRQELKLPEHVNMDHGEKNGSEGKDLTTFLAPAKGSRFDAPPAKGAFTSSSATAPTKTTTPTTAVKVEIDHTVSSRERLHTVLTLPRGENSFCAGESLTAMASVGGGLNGNSREMGIMIGVECGEAVQELHPQRKKSAEAVGQFQITPPRQDQDNILAA